MISWCPSVKDNECASTPPIHHPGQCILYLTKHILFNVISVEDAVHDTLHKWKRRGTIFQAAGYMIPYCRHPLLYRARAYMRVLAFPFNVLKDELKTRMESLEKLENFDREIKIVSLLDFAITTQWCLAHLRLHTKLVRDILLHHRTRSFTTPLRNDQCRTPIQNQCEDISDAGREHLHAGRDHLRVVPHKNKPHGPKHGGKH